MMLAHPGDVQLPRLTPDAPPPPGLGPGADHAARSVPTARIVDWLALGGSAYELRAGERAAAEATAQARAALVRWRARGLPADSERFDPVATLNFGKCEALAGRDDFWTRRFVATGRRLVWEHHTGPARAAPPSPRDLPPRQFAVTLSRTFHVAGIVPGTTLRLRLPLPLETPELSDLVVRPHAAAGAALAVTPGRLEARLVAGAADAIVLGAHCEFVARPMRIAGTSEPPECELYTRPAEGLIQVTPRVRALAAALAGATPRHTVRAFWEHLLGDFGCGAVHYHDIPPSAPTDWVLDHRWYDCQLGSALLVALCRAQNIPARLVGGHVLYEAAPFHHFWAEIWLADTGWSPFDLLGWDLAAGGRDPAWRDCFAGHADYRMKTQVFPHLFTGPMSVRLPARWHILSWAEADGIATGFTDLDSGRPVFTDRIVVRRGDQAGASVNAGPL